MWPPVCTSYAGTTGRVGSPNNPGCTNGKWPKSVKFSTCLEAADCHANGPVGTMVQEADSSSGTSGSGQRGSSSATQMSP